MARSVVKFVTQKVIMHDVGHPEHHKFMNKMLDNGSVHDFLNYL